VGTPPNAIHAMVASTQDKVYILESLQKSDFATMSVSDQKAIAGTDTFRIVLALRFSLSATADDANAAIQNALADINNTNSNDPAHGNSAFVSFENKEVFRQELGNIQSQLQTMGVFSTTEISSAVKAIQDRFDRVAAFSKAHAVAFTRSDF